MIRETIVTMVEPGGKIHIALIGITADGDHSLPFQGRHELAFVNRDGLESTLMSERKCSATPKAG
jgi:hypothetical protein